MENKSEYSFVVVVVVLLFTGIVKAQFASGKAHREFVYFKRVWRKTCASSLRMCNIVAVSDKPFNPTEEEILSLLQDSRCA